MLKQLLDRNAKQHLVRNRYRIDERDDTSVVIDGKKLLNFCSNDYLNLSVHPHVIYAFAKGAHDFGLGSGSSAQVAGYYKPHALLEEKFAEFLRRDRAILFNSGYHANLGVLTTFADRNSCVIADKYCHASIIDGILLSRAKYYRYQHQNLQQAEMFLQNAGSHTLVVSESVFSMQGDLTDVKKLAVLAQKYNSFLVMDDAHGIGILGQHGRGITELQPLSQEEIPCLVTPLGKAIGSLGAIVSGSDTTIETLLQFARTHRYTIALPPAVCFATVAALEVLQKETWRITELQSRIAFFIKEAKARNLPIMSQDATPIKCILLGSNEKTARVQSQLFNKGIYISCLRPPTVPKNTARLRISINCMHTEEDIIKLLDALLNCLNTGSETPC